MGINDNPKIRKKMSEIVADRSANGFVFYVLWYSSSGLRIWSGPYQDEYQAKNSTAMLDKTKKAFVIEAK